ncbi:MAG: hypothetical protein ISS56_19080 [Anaerolineae bacterium]|nr:hypothetical protein [Anaerolineae bacterium]
MSSASTYADRLPLEGDEEPDATFTNIPLSEIEVIFRSLAGDRVTVASMACKPEVGEPLEPFGGDVTDGDLDDLKEVYTNLLPDTYICTIVVDP